jgi:hypothetical protein
MKLVTHLLCVGALIVSPLSTGCSSNAEETAVGDDALTGTIGVGTYVVDARPSDGTYAARLTFAAGQKYEAEIVSGSGDTTLLAGGYVILPARPNDPQSPVASDKPTLVLSSDSGGTGASFELDKLPNGSLQLYGSARHVIFTMKKDPSWQPAPTNRKVIACTGPAADAKLTLDQAQNRRGTLEIVRKAAAGSHDPPSVTVQVTTDEFESSPDYVYFMGRHGQQDYYVNMKKNDFERGSGSVELNLRWAQDGQEWSVGTSCAFAR